MLPGFGVWKPLADSRSNSRTATKSAYVVCWETGFCLPTNAPNTVDSTSCSDRYSMNGTPVAALGVFHDNQAVAGLGSDRGPSVGCAAGAWTLGVRCHVPNCTGARRRLERSMPPAFALRPFSSLPLWLACGSLPPASWPPTGPTEMRAGMREAARIRSGIPAATRGYLAAPSPDLNRRGN